MSARDPVRLADQPAGDELAAALRALRAERGSSQQVQALGERLTPLLSAPPLSAGSGALSVLTKRVLGGLITLATGLGLLAYAVRPGSAPPRSAAKVPTPAAAVAADPPAPRAEISPPAAAPAPAVPAAAPRIRRGPRTHALAAPAAERELELLERSRAALDREPEIALGHAEAHARAYPQGVFAQEREVLAIEALLKLRKRAQAIARAERFMQRYADSSHARRVRALIERSRTPAAAAPPERPASDSSPQVERENREHATERE